MANKTSDDRIPPPPAPAREDDTGRNIREGGPPPRTDHRVERKDD